MIIYNCTQHPATEEQLQQGVVDFQGSALSALKCWLTFNECPTLKDLELSALVITDMVLAIHDFNDGIPVIMAGGAPYFMPVLERIAKERGILVWYSYSMRVSEEVEVNGEVVKTSHFKHIGWVKS